MRLGGAGGTRRPQELEPGPERADVPEGRRLVGIGPSNGTTAAASTLRVPIALATAVVGGLVTIVLALVLLAWLSAQPVAVNRPGERLSESIGACCWPTP